MLGCFFVVEIVVRLALGDSVSVGLVVLGFVLAAGSIYLFIMWLVYTCFENMRSCNPRCNGCNPRCNVSGGTCRCYC